MLASQGLRTTVRNAPNLPHLKGGTGASRAIHIPSFARVQHRLPNLAHTQRLFSQSRHILTRFFNLLATPGIRIPTQSTVGHSLQSATRSYSVQQGFSPRFKSGFFRSVNSHILPRAPVTAPRGIAQVGLQSARNFHSSRPIFQNLVENVPVFGRAIYEADLDLKLHKEKESMRERITSKASKTEGSKEMLKPRSVERHSAEQEQLDQYFVAPDTSDTTTVLLIPLAPTPTAHVPLAENPGTLLPLSTIATLHAAYETHSLRVSTLFSKLDLAHVWERGAHFSAYSHRTGAEGVCTMLKVEFVGWTKAEVRSVLGESGTGWCVLEEVPTSENAYTRRAFFDDSDTSADDLSDASSVISGTMFEDSANSSYVDLTPTVDPAQSLVLPTLDFSSSFMASAAPPRVSATTHADGSSSRFTPLSNRDDPNFDPWSGFDSPSSDYGLSRSSSWVDHSTAGWNGFSSQFMARVEDDGRPHA